MNQGTIFSNNLFASIEEPSNTIDEKRNIMDTVYINNFFIIFAFCCIRKRNNVNNYMLKEGLNIIKERLDILNIFQKLYCEEQIIEVYKIKKNDIKMSDDCKKKLQWVNIKNCEALVCINICIKSYYFIYGLYIFNKKLLISLNE